MHRLLDYRHLSESLAQTISWVRVNQLSPLTTFKLLVSSHFQPSPILTDIFLSHNVHSQLKTPRIKFLSIQSHLKTPHTTWKHLALVYRSYLTIEENNSIPPSPIISTFIFPTFSTLIYPSTNFYLSMYNAHVKNSWVSRLTYISRYPMWKFCHFNPIGHILPPILASEDFSI